MQKVYRTWRSEWNRHSLSTDVECGSNRVLRTNGCITCARRRRDHKTRKSGPCARNRQVFPFHDSPMLTTAWVFSWGRKEEGFHRSTGVTRSSATSRSLTRAQGLPGLTRFSHGSTAGLTRSHINVSSAGLQINFHSLESIRASGWPVIALVGCTRVLSI